jgi:hypothetical protein
MQLKGVNLKTMVHHCMTFIGDVFKYLHSLYIPVGDGLLDRFQYKAKLKNESCINMKPLIVLKVKFALVSDYPAIL